MIPKFLATKKGDEYSYRYPEQRQAYIESLKDGDYHESIAPIGKDPTGEQRGYYFGVICQPAGESLGYTKDEMDDVLRKAHLPWVDGKKDRYQKRISMLSRYEYSRFIDDCIITLAKMGYVVEPPNRNWNSTNWYKEK